MLVGQAEKVAGWRNIQSFRVAEEAREGYRVAGQAEKDAGWQDRQDKVTGWQDR